MIDLFPDAIFGEPPEDEEDDEDLPLEDDNDETDDDEELPETSPDVIAMLGFDPAKEED